MGVEMRVEGICDLQVHTDFYRIELNINVLVNKAVHI